MSVLNSKFDILRGYPNGSGMPWPFPIKMNGAVPYAIAAGDIVTQETQNNQTVVNKATTPNTSTNDPVQAWLVVEGNDDFSGQFVRGCNTVLISSGVVWQTGDFAQGTYAPGTAVSFSAGQVKEKAANEQILAYVLENRIATTGVLVLAGK